jgi:thioredoxin 2
MAMPEALHVVCPHCDGVNRVAADKLGQGPNCGRCHQALFTGEPVALDGERFAKHVARSDLPVIADFWAAWCGPCRAVAPVFARAAKSLEPHARFVKVDVDANPQLASQYGVQGIPALFAFSGGKVAAKQAGLGDPSIFKTWVERFSPAKT